MNKVIAEEIINYVVSKTEPLWNQWINLSYSNLDEIFMKSAYEQGGFAAWAFYDLLISEGINSINDLGNILELYKGEKKYLRIEKGSLESPFYLDLKAGLYGVYGKKFYNCADKFLNEKLGNPGAFFWVKLWQMLVCCRDLKQNYHSSFKYYLKKKYSDFINIPVVSDNDFYNVDNNNWERFKKEACPWDELYGIGDNVFDYLVRNIEEFKFNRDAFKLDSANIHFFNVTGIAKLFDINNKVSLIKFLKGLKLEKNYNLKEINTGIYSYCSETEREKFGFCRSKEKCVECGVNSICKKNF